ADEQAAGTAPPDGEAAWTRVAPGDEVLRASDEVVEGVALPQQLAVLVPLPPHLSPTSHVCDREGETSVEQAEAGGVEHRVVRKLIGAIAVEQERTMPPRRLRHHLPVNGEEAEPVLAVDDRDRHLYPVLRGRP